MHKHHYKPEATVPTVSVGDEFRVDLAKLTVIAIDGSAVWLRAENGIHYERRIEEIANCGKYVVRTTDLPGYPIAEMPEDGKFYLVSVEGYPGNPGVTPYSLCQKVNGVFLPLYRGGAFCGATHYHPFTLTYPS
jgi:hypothetical protein